MKKTTTSFSWLHLTDLHCGMKEQEWLWPNVREMVLNDLEKLYEKCGPWDLVLFTGDLTQKGSEEEFKRVDEILRKLWEKFEELGFCPQFLAVPGNHDLVRPNEKAAAVKAFRQWADDSEIREAFWDEVNSDYRQVIVNAFTNYTNWCNKQPFKAKSVQSGLLPGDFAATIDNGKAKIGVVGMNTAFLQLTAGEYESKLALNIRQIHDVCNKNLPDWAKQHRACLLLTHHPPTWLNPESRQHLNTEITMYGRFAVHLCGHAHETESWEIVEGGTQPRRIWQGRSLFGLEYFGNDHKGQRRHGYSVGKIEFQENIGNLSFWPRKDEIQGGQQNIVPDYSIDLTDAQHTSPKEFKLLQPYKTKEKQTSKKTSKEHKEEKHVPRKSKSQSLATLPKNRRSVNLFSSNISVQGQQATKSPSKLFTHYISFDSDLFVNRKNENARFFEMLLNRPKNFVVPKAYLAFTGIAGQGKSSLLKRVGYDAQEKGYCFVYIDFEDNVYRGERLSFILGRVADQISAQITSDPFQTFRKVLSLTSSITEEALIKIFREDLNSVLNQSSPNGVILCFDSTEKAESRVLVTFEEHVLAHYIDVPNFMLVTAGQEDFVWKRTELKSRIERYRLQCLDTTCIIEQVKKLANKEKFDIIEEEDQTQSIWSQMSQLSLGHPLSNFTLVHFWTDKFKAPLTHNAVNSHWRQSTVELVEKVIKDQVLKGFRFNPELPAADRILQYLSMPRYVDIGIGCYILTDILKTSSPHRLYGRLIQELQKKFIIQSQDWARPQLDPVVRNIMFQHMRLNESQEFLSIQDKLSQQYQRWVDEITDDEKKVKNFIEYLYHKAIYLTEKQPNNVDEPVHQDLMGYLNMYANPNKLGEETLLKQQILLRRALEDDKDLNNLLDVPHLIQTIESYA